MAKTETPAPVVIDADAAKKAADRLAAKHDKFVELAQSRVTNALEKISLIGNLANKNNYEFSEEEIAKIFKAIDDTCETVEASFKAALAGKPTKSGGGFSF